MIFGWCQLSPLPESKADRVRIFDYNAPNSIALGHLLCADIFSKIKKNIRKVPTIIKCKTLRNWRFLTGTWVFLWQLLRHNIFDIARFICIE